MKQFIISILVLLTGVSVLANNGEIYGKIIDSESNVGMPYVTIRAESGSTEIITSSDDFGFYIVKPLPPGNYTISTDYFDYTPTVVQNIIVGQDEVVLLDIEMLIGVTITGITFIDYNIPLIPKTDIPSLGLNNKDLEHMPLQRPSDAIALSPGVTQNDSGDDIYVRGSRTGSTAYYVDGMRVPSLHGVAMLAVNTMKVYTGAVPAKYGDCTGGVVVVNIKNY